MGMTPYEFQQLQKAGKPQSGNLLDAPRPHFIRGREEAQLRYEAQKFADDWVSREEAIGLVAQDNARTNWLVADSEEGFRQFQQQLHGEQSAVEEDLEGLSQEEIAAKMVDAQDRIDQQERADRLAWEAFKKRPTSQFLRKHPELSESDLTQIDLQLTEWRLPAEKANLDQLEEAYQAVFLHGLLRPTTRKSAEPTVDPYTLSMEELERRAGGRDTAVVDDYVPTGSRFGAMGFTFEPGEER
jgi:hypothetical protein